MIHELMVHLWQSTLFAIAAGLLTLAFRKNRAKVRFGLWLSASLKFFVPFTLLMNFGSQIQWTPAAHQIVTQYATPAVAFAVEYVTQPFSTGVTDSPRSTDWMPIAMLSLWGCGFLTIVMVRLKLWRRIRAVARASAPLEIAAPVGVRSAPGLLEPGVVGLLKPVLLLPEGIVARLTPSELEAVLAHELCHVRRRDNLFATAHMIVEAIFWFHPLVWWIGARMVEERERACDEDVLNLGNQPRVYADAILNVCKLYTESPLVCVSGVTGSDIRRRIEAIMTNRKGQTLNRAKKILLAAAGVAAVAGPVVVGVLIGLGHIPAIHAQVPNVGSLLPQVTVPTIAQSMPAVPPPPIAPSDTPAVASEIIRYQDRRLTALLFDFTAMTRDEQLRAQSAGISFVRDDLQPGDLVTVMVATGQATPVKIVQDFTDNSAVLLSALQSIIVEGGRAAANGTDNRLATIATAATMLGGFPGKKALRYFSAGFTQTVSQNQLELRDAITTAMQSNVAILPIDVRGYASGGALASPLPAGISRDEYDRRVAEAQSKFGSLNNVLSRTYLRYGAPDQIDAPVSGTTQVWRYNYLANFHSSTEFAFSQGKGATHPWLMNINYPAPSVYTATPSGYAGLAEALRNENGGRGRGPAQSANVTAGLPARHSSMAVYPAGETSKLSVPLDTLTGEVDVLAQVKTNAVNGTAGKVAGMLRDSITLAGTSQSGMYGSGFTLEAGSYVCFVLVREVSTGRAFTEEINFDVK